MPSRNPRALPPGLDPKAVPDHVAIVKDGEQLVSIVTKIDLIDWLGGRLGIR